MSSPILDGLLSQQFPVLPGGWIELLDTMPHADPPEMDQAIVSAARTSHRGATKGYIADRRLLRYLYVHRHTSPFEMAEIEIRCRAPLITWWQWLRHRSFRFHSVNAQSGRYTAFKEDEFYLPDQWREQAATNRQASGPDITPQLNEELTMAVALHYASAYELYKDMLAAGIAREQARLVLPGFACFYTFVVKSDVLNWLHFFSLRRAEEAQYEIRVYANAIYDHIFKPLLPWTAEIYEEELQNNGQ